MEEAARVAAPASELFFEHGRSRLSFAVPPGLNDPSVLSEAMTGFLAQPTDVYAYMMKIRSGVVSEPLDSRPIHYEIALV